MSLRKYGQKRNFTITSEPSGKTSTGKSGQRFVIQKHAATRLHYDLRLEIDGVLKSWAVPKGMPYKKGEKRLAVRVEDHPLEYKDFEGTIPAGQYGAGTVIVWDHGTYTADTPIGDLDKDGKLHFNLHGQKLSGEWYLVRLREENQWLVVRGGKNIRPVSGKADNTSVLSGKTLTQLAVTKESKPRKNSRLPGFIEPMAAKTLAAPPSSGNWIYEIKFDGWRALALLGGRRAELVSRNNKTLGPKFPEIADALAELDLEDTILDGEIVALAPNGISSFQLLQSAEAASERPEIYYYVFDLPWLRGEDLTQTPLLTRKAQLEALIPRASRIRFSAALGSDASPLLGKARSLGLEGLIGKRSDSHYEPGRRNGAWIKLKLISQQEFVIGGLTPPQGSRKYFGSLLLGVYASKRLQYVGRVGTGFTSRSLKDLHTAFKPAFSETCPFSNLPDPRKRRYGQSMTKAEMQKCQWLDPKFVCQVKFAEWTDDNRLRHPVFLGMRHDKKPTAITREVE